MPRLSSEITRTSHVSTIGKENHVVIIEHQNCFSFRIINTNILRNKVALSKFLRVTCPLAYWVELEKLIEDNCSSYF